MHQKGGVFFMENVQSIGDFVLVPLGLRFYGNLNKRFRKFNRGNFKGIGFTAQGIPGMLRNTVPSPVAVHAAILPLILRPVVDSNGTDEPGLAQHSHH